MLPERSTATKTAGGLGGDVFKLSKIEPATVRAALLQVRKFRLDRLGNRCSVIDYTHRTTNISDSKERLKSAGLRDPSLVISKGFVQSPESNRRVHVRLRR